MQSEAYEIRATMPADTPNRDVLVMLQNLLVERLRIQLHWEERQTPAYALVVDRDGPKLTSTPAPDDTPVFRPRGANSFTATNCTVDRLAAILTRYADRPVVDLTGIEGAYDFKLDWSASPTGPVTEGATVPALSVSGSDPLAVFSALRTLGLKAESRKIPLKYLIVDGAEKDPVDN
jgi:uncharacterized protein (TIGR03435 family)